MSALSACDVALLLNFVRALHEPRRLEDFPRHIVRALPQLVASDFTFYNEVDLREGRVVAQGDVPAPQVFALQPAWEAHLHQHPVIAHARLHVGDAPRAISDFLSMREWHRRALYNEFFRPLQIEDQLAIDLSNRPDVMIGITLNRARRSFSARERRLMELLQPHLLQAMENAREYSRLQAELSLHQNLLESMETGVLALEADNSIAFISFQAQAWLRDYFDDFKSARLPSAIENWLASSQNFLPLEVARANRVLTLRRMEDKRGTQLLVLQESASRTPSGDLEKLKSLGLTPRQSEVLLHLSRGQSNAQIAHELKLSTHTVKRHLEAIYDALQVSNRSAAAHRAQQILEAKPFS